MTIQLEIDQRYQNAAPPSNVAKVCGEFPCYSKVRLAERRSAKARVAVWSMRLRLASRGSKIRQIPMPTKTEPPLPGYDQLKKRVKGFQFEDRKGHPGPTFNSLVERLEQTVLAERGEWESTLKARILLCEVHDYLGRFDRAATMAEPGANILEALTHGQRIVSDHDFITAQAKARLATAYARTLYRRGGLANYRQAIDILDRCRKYIHESLEREDRPCFGTRGEIAYLVGRIHRQHQRIRESLAEFNRAIDLYDRRAVEKQRTAENTAEIAEQIKFSAYKCGTILALGTGWANYTSGALTRAMSENLIPARVLLSDTGDLLNKAYADVIYASTLRALAGDERPSLNRARDLVLAAASVFERYDHAHYSAGAHLELALIEMARKDFQRAADEVKAMQRSRGINDHRWACSAHIVMSRLERHWSRMQSSGDINHAQAAETHATNALNIASEHDEPLGKIDALIARGEAFAEQGQIHGAIGDLNDALKLNSLHGILNPKIEGSCRLQLTRHYLNQKNIYAALENFHQWEAVSSRVEHAHLHAVAHSIETALNRTTLFTIDASKDPRALDLKYQKRRLTEFLLQQVSMLKNTAEEKAELLGVSRTWLDKLSKNLVAEASDTALASELAELAERLPGDAPQDAPQKNQL